MTKQTKDPKEPGKPKPVQTALVELAIHQLRQHPHEQASRLSASALAGLRSDIAASGVIAPLVVARNGVSHYTVIDGNRRLQIAQDLGRSVLACQLIEGSQDVDVLFIQLNRHVRSMRGAERLNYLANCPDKWDALKQQWPTSFQRHLRDLEEAVGRPYARKMGAAGLYGPEVMGLVRQLQAGFISKKLIVDTGDIVKWMLDHAMQNVVNAILRARLFTTPTARKLAKCVEDNVPYKRPGMTVPLRRASLSIVAKG